MTFNQKIAPDYPTAITEEFHTKPLASDPSFGQLDQSIKSVQSQDPNFYRGIERLNLPLDVQLNAQMQIRDLEKKVRAKRKVVEEQRSANQANQ